VSTSASELVRFCITHASHSNKQALENPLVFHASCANTRVHASCVRIALGRIVALHPSRCARRANSCAAPLAARATSKQLRCTPRGARLQIPWLRSWRAHAPYPTEARRCCDAIRNRGRASDVTRSNACARTWKECHAMLTRMLPEFVRKQCGATPARMLAGFARMQ
jgi:hypothetical protein